MAFKIRRQRRYNRLKLIGFLPFEARELSKLTLRHMRVPYIAIMIKERVALMEDAVRRRWSRRKYEAGIKEEYRNNGWFRRTALGVLKDDPWMMLRANEDAYRRKFPSYTSPWQKKIKDFRRFARSVDRTVRKHAQDWLAQLDESIKKARTPERRAQLELQRENLRTWLE